MVLQRRNISEKETEIIRAALQQVPVLNFKSDLFSIIDSLKVVGRCDCGCATIEFERDLEKSPPPSKLIANGVGTTPAGGTVGVIVWGCEDAITGLEIYDLGAGESDLNLPIPNTIHSFKSDGAT